jgi:hypothetical protein
MPLHQSAIFSSGTSCDTIYSHNSDVLSPLPRALAASLADTTDGASQLARLPGLIDGMVAGPVSTAFGLLKLLL